MRLIAQKYHRQKKDNMAQPYASISVHPELDKKEITIQKEFFMN